jgi:hypothetical protein
MRVKAERSRRSKRGKGSSMAYAKNNRPLLLKGNILMDRIIFFRSQAEPNEEYFFVSWSSGAKKNSNPLSY